MLISMDEVLAVINKHEHVANTVEGQCCVLAVRAELERIKAAHEAEGYEKPYALSIEEEEAMAVYLPPDLFKYLESLDDNKEVTLIDVGKLYLKIKPFLQEGRIRKAKKY